MSEVEWLLAGHGARTLAALFIFKLLMFPIVPHGMETSPHIPVIPAQAGNQS